MSSHEEIFKGVSVIYDKGTQVLSIYNEDGDQLAVFYVMEED